MATDGRLESSTAVSEQITHCPAELAPKGRMAIGKTDDPRFVLLERDRYSLPMREIAYLYPAS